MKLFLTAIAAAALCSCANPSITNIQTSRISANSGPVLVTRFEGNPDFVEEATDMFVSHLKPASGRQVIQGGVSRNESTDILRGGNIANDAARAAAQRAGAKMVIVGKTTSHATEGMLNGFVTARIIEANTGATIATVHRPSGKLMGYSEHQCVMAAAERAAKALSPSL